MINLNCPSCGYGLAIPDQYAGKSGRCKKCGATIEVPSGVVSPPETKTQEPDPSPPPIPDIPQFDVVPEWFYVVDRVKQGPLDEYALRQKFSSEQLPPTTLVWQKGQEQWLPAKQVPAFESIWRVGSVPNSPVESTNQPSPPSITYAGFWKRTAAFLIDSVVLSLVYAPIYLYLLYYPAMEKLNSGIAPSERELVQFLWAYFLSSFLLCLFLWIYSAGMESSSKQGTLGKIALGIQVTDINGNRISFWRATGRNCAKLLSVLIMYMGFLMAAFTDRKQTLHDVMSGCLVINKSP